MMTLILIAKSSQGIQEHLNALRHFYKELHMQVNTGKS